MNRKNRTIAFKNLGCRKHRLVTEMMLLPTKHRRAQGYALAGGRACNFFPKFANLGATLNMPGRLHNLPARGLTKARGVGRFPAWVRRQSSRTKRIICEEACAAVARGESGRLLAKARSCL
ncbi:protein of unknown function [Burkholderia multivorans]